jgi:hypothetical protein
MVCRYDPASKVSVSILETTPTPLGNSNIACESPEGSIPERDDNLRFNSQDVSFKFIEAFSDEVVGSEGELAEETSNVVFRRPVLADIGDEAVIANDSCLVNHLCHLDAGGSNERLE